MFLWGKKCYEFLPLLVLLFIESLMWVVYSMQNRSQVNNFRSTRSHLRPTTPASQIDFKLHVERYSSITLSVKLVVSSLDPAAWSRELWSLTTTNTCSEVSCLVSDCLIGSVSDSTVTQTTLMPTYTQNPRSWVYAPDYSTLHSRRTRTRIRGKRVVSFRTRWVHRVLHKP